LHEKIPGVEFADEGNWAEARSVAGQIQTLDQLIDACNVDLDIWRVLDWNIRAYDGWRADTDKDLAFDEGKISGYVRSKGITTQTLWSVFAKLIRINPQPIRPTFQPLSCPITYPHPSKPGPGAVTRSVILADSHIGFEKNLKNAELYPFHDRRALDVVAQIVQSYQPDLIGIVGDWFDMSRWTKKFASEPEFYWTTQPAILEGHWWLRRLRDTCPQAGIIYLEGNHEKRLQDFVRDHMMEAYQLGAVVDQVPVLSMPHLLDLSGLQIDWIGGYPEARYCPADWLCWEHGDIARVPGGTAKAVIEHAMTWRVFGHIHRREVVSKTFGGGRNISGTSFGCLCHVDGRLPGSSRDSQWQQGIGIMEFTEDFPSPVVEAITIRDGVALWRGAKFVGVDNVEVLKKTFPDWNW